MAEAAAVAVRLGELFATLASARAFFTVASRVEHVAFAFPANIRLFQLGSEWFEVSRLTFVTIDTLRVIPAIVANTASFVFSMDID